MVVQRRTRRLEINNLVSGLVVRRGNASFVDVPNVELCFITLYHM